MREETIATPRGRFAARLQGSAEAPIAILLHGFPDDASTFDALGATLASQGRRAIAPYLRGYAPSPLDGDLGLSGLADDLLSLIDAVSPEVPIHIVGHDYGSQIGYLAMTRRPDRFQAAVMLAGAHPAVIKRNIGRLPRQWWMSRYIAFFQLGGIADRAVARNDFAYVEQLWRRWAPGFAAPSEHMARVKATLRRSMPAPVAMYRAGGFDLPDVPIAVPMLFVAGADDGCLLPELANGQERLFAEGYASEVWSGVGHFPHLESPGRVAAAVTGWFSRYV